MFCRGQTLTLENTSYQLNDLLPQQGNHAQVWLVTKRGEQNLYVLKAPNIPKFNPQTQQAFSSRQQAEIDLLHVIGQAAHEHYLGTLVDSGTVDTPFGPIPVLVMPFYAGKFPEWIQNKQVTYSFSQALQWLQQIAHALHYLHQPPLKIIHRDLKPANILLDDQQQVRVIDFGIAKPDISDGDNTSSLFSSRWAAPEQILPCDLGKDNQWQFHLTTATDVFSFGLISYYLLSCGRETAYQNAVKTNYDSIRNGYWHRQPTRKPWVDALQELADVDERDQRQFFEGVQTLFAEAYTDVDGTIGGLSPALLPNSQWIKQKLWQFIQQWLAPNPEQRPTMTSVLQQLTLITQALQPHIQQLTLTPPQLALKQGDTARFTLHIKGKFLPAITDWLVTELNAKAYSALQWQLISPLPSDELATDFLEWQLTLDPLPLGESYELSISATAWQQTTLRTSATIQVSASPAQLWEQGKFYEALRLDPRPEWLHTLEKQLDGSVEKAWQHLVLLRELNQRYPTNTALTERIQSFERAALQNKKLPIMSLIGTSLIAALLGSGLTYWQVTPQHPIQPQTAFSLPETQLQTLSQTLITNFKVLLASSDQQQQQLAKQQLQQLLDAHQLHPDSEIQAQQLLHTTNTPTLTDNNSSNPSSNPQRSNSKVSPECILGIKTTKECQP